MLIRDKILKLFPHLRQADCAQTSRCDFDYNCIGFAADPSMPRWWWPIDPPGREAYWPTDAPRELTLDAFEKAFETVRYKRCADGQLKPGHEKIALFAKDNGEPTHAARQKPNGLWTSKLGPLEDIEHPLLQVESEDYGHAAIFMSRPLAPLGAPPCASG